jgi:hypothetical protein
VSRKLFFSSIIRGFLEGYLRQCATTWNSVTNLSLDTTGDIINAWVTVASVIIIVGLPITSYIFLRKFREKLEEEDFKGRFESLYLNVDTNIMQATLLVPLFTFRRLIFSINLFFCSSSTQL